MPVEVPDKAVCIGCGYSLRGLPEPVCPECGRAFDPADRSTFETVPRSLKWRRWASAPPWWHILCIVAATVLTLEGCSRPAQFNPRLLCLGPVLFCLLVVDYFARTLTVRYDRRRAQKDRQAKARTRKSVWVVAPLCIAFVVSSVLYDWPLRARFHLSRSAVDQAALSYLAAPGKATKPQWIGLYRVGTIFDPEPGIIAFQTDSPFDMYGFAYCPSGPAATRPARDIRFVEHLAPSWYLYHERF